MNRIVFPLLAMITACESGNSVVVDLTVSDSVATSFTSASPGVLRVATSSGAESYAPLCGSPVAALEIVRDYGFGCLSDVGRSTESLQAWVEPLPSGWDAAGFCTLSPAPRGLSLSKVAPKGADGGTDDSLAEQPDPSWHQVQGSAPWQRDGSACGGIARGTLTLD